MDVLIKAYPHIPLSGRSNEMVPLTFNTYFKWSIAGILAPSLPGNCGQVLLPESLQAAAVLGPYNLWPKLPQESGGVFSIPPAPPRLLFSL